MYIIPTHDKSQDKKYEVNFPRGFEQRQFAQIPKKIQQINAETVFA